MNLLPGGLLPIFLIFIVDPLHAQEQWQGYLNDKTFDDRKYGYLFKNSESAAQKKIRFICKAPNTFVIYLPDLNKSNSNPVTVALTVDALPEIEFTPSQLGSSKGLTNNAENFWQLVAQMVAGASLQVKWPTETTPVEYSLYGFTDTYTRLCGWIDSSRQYVPFLKRFR